jgi:hypothetical protein
MPNTRGAGANTRIMPGGFAILPLHFHRHRTGSGYTRMKYFLGLLIVMLVAAVLLFFTAGEQHGEQDGSEPVTGLPWQIQQLPGGDTQVFGITPGRTTLGEVIGRLGDDLDLAIIARPREAGTLEAYYSHYSAGPITGSLILVLDVPADTLLALRTRAFQDGGTRRYHLHPDDLPAAYQAAVRAITFMPSFGLDESIVRARFGAPAEIIQVDAQQHHWLYPELGLDLVLNEDGKDLLQYLSPRAFGAHVALIQQASVSGE